MADRLASYELVRLLGRGGMAEVWEGRRLTGDTHGPVAIKTLRLEDSGDRGSVRRLLEEAQLGASLDHPHLVRTLEVLQEEQPQRRVGIVMEMLDGVTLAEVCRPDQVPPLEWTVAVARQILDGLDYLHRATGPDGRPLGLVHRDLKPSNLLVTRGGVAKIIDFGVASLQGLDRTLTRTGVLRGSLPYCSPEIARHERLDARSDLFSFGLVLYELLTGRRCFDQSSEAAILSAVLWAPAPPVRQSRPDAPVALEQLVGRLLEKDPAKRPASAREVRAQLDAAWPAASEVGPPQIAAWLAGAVARRPTHGGETASALELAAPVPDPPPEAPPAPRRRRPVFVVLAAGFLALVGGATLALRARGGPPAPVVAVAPPPPAPSVAPAPAPAAPVVAPAPAPTPAPPPARRAVRAHAAARRSGWLTVGVSSGWANVAVGGRSLGPTPIFRHALPAGRHTVVFTHADGRRRTQVVVIEPDRERKVAVDWSAPERN